jgi:hypothetical protein
LNSIYRSEDHEPYSDQLECARCGEQFYYEQHECPNCGARVYSGFDVDEDELHVTETDAEGRQGWAVEAAAVLSGWFISALIVTALFLPLRNGLSIQPGSLSEQLLLFSLAAICGFIAAWMVVRLVGRRWKLHGLLAGMGGLIAAGVLFWILYGYIQPLLGSPAAWLALPVVLCAGWLGAAQAERMFRTPHTDSLFGNALQEKLLYQRLLALTRNDSTTVERLIAYEKQRLPRASRQELMQRAIQRWERDNR